MRRRPEPVDLWIVRLDLLHDAPDRLVDEREPDLLRPGHRPRIGQTLPRAPHAICRATTTSNAAKRRRSVRSASDSATNTPAWGLAAAAIPMMRAARQRTFP